MGTQTQIARIAAAKTDIKTSITNKGVTVPAGTKIDGMSAYIDAIDTSENLDEVLTEQESIIDQISAALEGKAGASVEFGWFSIIGYNIHLSNAGDSGLYKLPFVIGTTWREWLMSSMNMELYTYMGKANKLSANGDYVECYNFNLAQSATVSTDGTVNGQVNLDNSIVNEFTYYPYSAYSGGGGYD